MNQCPVCSRYLSSKQRLISHLNSRSGCGQHDDGRAYLSRNGSNLGEQITSLNMALQSLTDQMQRSGVGSTTNIMYNSNNNNNNNNIRINGFGQEDLSRVTHDFLTECLKQLPNGNQGMLDLVKLIHLDTEQNRNVKCVKGDENDLVMSYFDASKGAWMIESKRKVLDGIMRSPRVMLKDHFQFNRDTFERHLTSALQNFLHLWFESTGNKKNHIYEDTTRRIHDMVKRWSSEMADDICRKEEELEQQRLSRDTASRSTMNNNTGVDQATQVNFELDLNNLDQYTRSEIGDDSSAPEDMHEHDE